MHSFSVRNKERLEQILILMACSFCLLFPALYNGYPLVTPDTGAYVSTGWLLHVPIDRPITYSIFIRITSLFGLSLWGVVWAQTFILVYYLRRVCEKLLKEYFSQKVFFCIVLLLSAFTSIGWVSSQLMPDIFTPILILCILDFFLSPSGNAKKKVVSFFIIWFFMEQHNSNLLIVLIFCILARLYSVFSKNKWFIKKTLFLFGVTLFSFISISFFNLWEGNSFRPSASTHVFMMARMAENGILDQYLKEYCPTEHYSLCKFQGQTGDRQWYFMWNEKDLPHVGGWDKAEKEYSSIIFRTFITPKYLALQIYEALEGTLRQMPQLTVSFLIQGEDSSPYKVIQERFPREIKEYRTSLQQLNQLQPITSFFNALAFLFSIVTVFTSLMLYKKGAINDFKFNWNFLAVVIILFVAINAFVTATFSTVIDRLQSRVFWLIPFTAVLFIINHYLKSKGKLFIKNSEPNQKSSNQ